MSWADSTPRFQWPARAWLRLCRSIDDDNRGASRRWPSSWGDCLWVAGSWREIYLWKA